MPQLIWRREPDRPADARIRAISAKNLWITSATGFHPREHIPGFECSPTSARTTGTIIDAVTRSRSMR
jgi:hypothetical protein